MPPFSSRRVRSRALRYGFHGKAMTYLLRGHLSPGDRMGKDLPDIAFLTVINDLDPESVIRPLCDSFGSKETYELIMKHVEGIRP